MSSFGVFVLDFESSFIMMIFLMLGVLNFDIVLNEH